MTREEELDWLCRLRSEIYVYMPKEWLNPMNEALDMAIKSLEQEPILDKIRAEIEFEVDHRTNMLCAEDVFEIIDKYRAESEVENGYR